MSRSTDSDSRDIIRRWAIVLIAGFALGPGSATAGGFLSPGLQDESPKPEFVTPAKRMEVVGDGVEALTAALGNAEMRVREAWQNVATAEANYLRAQTRRYPRGAKRLEIRARAIEMGNEQIAAEQDFSTLVEKARRGGVPMRTLSPYLDFDVEIARRKASRQDGGS